MKALIVLLLLPATIYASERPIVTQPRQTSGDKVVQPSWQDTLTVTVGNEDADLVGNDQRVIQAAVDSIARFGGGTVHIKAGTYRLREETFTVRIEGQEGRRVWGNISSSQRVGERLIGSIAADNKAVYFVSGEGYIDGVVVDANTMDICYRHVLPGSAVVACNQWVRQK